VVADACAFYTAQAAAGAPAPGIPRALCISRRKIDASPGHFVSRECECAPTLYRHSGHREAMSPESILTIVVMDSGLAPKWRAPE